MSDEWEIVSNNITKRELLICILDCFNSKKANYCLVGDTSQYPYHIDSDVDIVVSPYYLHAVIGMLFEICESLELHIVQVLQHEQTAKYFVIAWYDNQGELCFLRPDICSDYYRKGRLFLPAEDLLDGRVLVSGEMGSEKNYYIARPAREFLYYLMKRVDKQALDDRQGQHLSLAFVKDPDGAKERLRRYWSEGEAELIADAARSNDWRNVRKVLSRIQESLQRNLTNSLNGFWNEFLRKAQRFVKPTGLFISFLGPDGAGKGSVIARVQQELAPAFRRTKRFHLMPDVGKRRNSATPVTAPYAKLPRGVVASVIKLCYFWAVYTFGYWLDIRPRLVRSTLVLFDRYYHDLLADRRRYRYGAPQWLARVIGRIVPKPDMWIILDVQPRLLQERKQEVSAEESTRQREAYLRLARELSHAIVVDASLPLPAVMRQVNQALLEFMDERVRKRMAVAVHDAQDVFNKPNSLK